MIKTKRERQVDLEQEQIEIGVKRYRDKIQATPETEMPPGLALMNMSIEPVKKAIDDLKVYKGGGKRNHEIKKFLQELDSYEVAYLTCRQIINKISMPINLQGVAVDLSKVLITHYEYKKFKKEMPQYVKAVKKNMNAKGTASKQRRGYVMMHMKRKKGIEDTDFSNVDLAHMGVKLIEIFIETTSLAKMNIFVDGKKKMYMLEGTAKAKEWIQDKHAQCELLSPEFLPMIVEPNDWEDPFSGGYLTADSNLRLKLVKTRNQKAIQTLKNNPESMQGVYESINTLQKTKWQINKDILAIMEDAWVSDNGIGGIPTDQEEPLPVRPWGILEDDEWETFKKDPKNKDMIDRWKNETRDVHQRRIKNRSKRYQMARKIWVARKFKDEEEIYFCWVLDWRGRVYPVQNHVNPQGDDVAKGLLKFKEGKPLGDRGAYWLKVHIANCFGEDKVSFEDRVAWVNNNQDQIVASAEDPMVNRFWEEADDPWQALAGAMELKGYIEQGPEFISHLPVAMDGSCNGLQNFAGMLKDPVGGESVNLLPAEKPQDVYQRVADKVEELISNDYSKPALAWKGKVTRKIVKRPVMTLPYGVTFIGMQDQIKDLLTELDEDDPYLGGLDNKEGAKFLTEKIQESLTQTVTSAREAMDWLQDITRVANKAEVPVVWNTPVGYIPYQDYKKQKSKRIETFWGTSNVRVRLAINEELNDIDKRGQISGISPNFVHSMDASHMMLTVLSAKEEGIKDFAMVHDSFGTHASDIDTLQRVIRESFVKMYTDHNVLEKFYNQVKDQLPEKYQKELPEVPKQGNLDLQKVLKSRYFFA